MTDAAASTSQVWTIARLLDWTRGHFKSRGLDEPRLCAELLLAKAVGCRRIDLYTRFDQVPSPAQVDAFRSLVREAARRKPIAYLTGVKEFYSLEFRVSPDVLIPRPESELLVDQALDWARSNSRERFDILDVGTGSGCLGIAIARRLPAARVIATDVSDAALALAAENARRHGVADRVITARADLLDLPAGLAPPGGFDVIVSNPPYVAEDRPDELADDVRTFEPHVALFGGPDGLALYRRMAPAAPAVLRGEGRLILETGYDAAQAVEELFTREAGLTCVSRHRDLRGILRALVFAKS